MEQVIDTPRRFGRPPRAARLADRDLDRLVVRAQAGDSAAAADLCSACRAEVRRYIGGILHDAEETDDATQEVLLKVIQALPRYVAGPQSFRRWLFTIAQHQAIDRQRAHRAALVDPDEVARLAEAGEATDSEPPSPRSEHRALLELIAPLSPRRRAVIVLLYLHDFSPEQAGRALGRTAAAIRQDHQRAREQLRAIVDAEASIRDSHP
jgi:RNA polymerase sigma-70 factor (ECF subfamily)